MFLIPGDQGEQGKMDLLTALLHELSHRLRQGQEANRLMDETLTAGTRQVPASGTDRADPTAVL